MSGQADWLTQGVGRPLIGWILGGDHPLGERSVVFRDETGYIGTALHTHTHTHTHILPMAVVDDNGVVVEMGSVLTIAILH